MTDHREPDQGPPPDMSDAGAETRDADQFQGVPVPPLPIEAPTAQAPTRGAIGRFFLDPTRRLRTVWRFLIFGSGFFFIQLGAGIVLAIGLVIYLAASGELETARHDGGEQLMDRLLALMEESALVLAVSAVLTTPICFGLVVGCRKLFDRRTVRSMGFVRPQRRPSSSVLVGLLAGLVPIVLAAALGWGLGAFEWRGAGWSWFPIWFAVPLLLAAFQEEILFRSYLLQNLLDIRRPVFGLLFTSVVFWLLHAFNPEAWTSPLVGINLFGAGVVLGLAYMASGNIWFPTAMHFGWNFAQGPLLSIPVSGIKMEGFVDLRVAETAPHWLTGGEFGLEASVLCTLVEIGLSAVLLKVWLSHERRQPVCEAELLERTE